MNAQTEQNSTHTPARYEHRLRAGWNMDGEWGPWKDGLASAHAGQPYYEERPLFAADVPGMLQVLREIERFGVNHPKMSQAAVVSAIEDLARAVIAKAEG